MNNVTERFLKYVSFDTKSDETTEVTPSTLGKWSLPSILKLNWKVWGWKKLH